MALSCLSPWGRRMTTYAESDVLQYQVAAYRLIKGVSKQSGRRTAVL